ncbi:hypothetical protein C4D60_Mb05t14000 [Musa balbisiana]|uniref:Uncharacterized protein n=1 Tax=Musa balbisiana TaxID=52838 RepID=A0A4V4H853_MUSBA|nr:hypothetical protein C4D60_Mb05t14000 [Musa balbisiana]
MGEGDLMSMFSKQFVQVALRSSMREVDKIFKWALVVYQEGTPNRWSTIGHSWHGGVSLVRGSATKP